MTLYSTLKNAGLISTAILFMFFLSPADGYCQDDPGRLRASGCFKACWKCLRNGKEQTGGCRRHRKFDIQNYPQSQNYGRIVGP